MDQSTLERSLIADRGGRMVSGTLIMNFIYTFILSLFLISTKAYYFKAIKNSKSTHVKFKSENPIKGECSAITIEYPAGNKVGKLVINQEGNLILTTTHDMQNKKYDAMPITITDEKGSTLILDQGTDEGGTSEASVGKTSSIKVEVSVHMTGNKPITEKIKVKLTGNGVIDRLRTLTAKKTPAPARGSTGAPSTISSTIASLLEDED